MALGVRGVGRGVFRATPAAKCRDALRRVAHLLPLELLRRHVLPDPLFFLPLGLLARRHHPLWCARALLQSGNQLLVSSSRQLFFFFKAAIDRLRLLRCRRPWRRAWCVRACLAPAASTQRCGASADIPLRVAVAVGDFQFSGAVDRDAAHHLHLRVPARQHPVGDRPQQDGVSRPPRASPHSLAAHPPCPALALRARSGAPAALPSPPAARAGPR